MEDRTQDISIIFIKRKDTFLAHIFPKGEEAFINMQSYHWLLTLKKRPEQELFIYQGVFNYYLLKHEKLPYEMIPEPCYLFCNKYMAPFIVMDYNAYKKKSGPIPNLSYVVSVLKEIHKKYTIQYISLTCPEGPYSKTVKKKIFENLFREVTFQKYIYLLANMVPQYNEVFRIIEGEEDIPDITFLTPSPIEIWTG